MDKFSFSKRNRKENLEERSSQKSDNYINLFISKYLVYILLFLLILVLYYYYKNYQNIINVSKKSKEETVCLTKICFDNGLIVECTTFTKPKLIKIEVIKSITGNGDVYNFVKLKDECDSGYM